MSAYRIERLGKQTRSSFDCGDETLNRYLRMQATQEMRRRYAVCYVLLENQTELVIGYYTLSAGSISFTDIPDDLAKRLPRYPQIPIARIGRLAVDRQYHSRGLGGLLLYDAIKRLADSEIGIHAVVVDAKNDAAATFYQRHGFRRFPDMPLVLYLPITDKLLSL